MLSLKNITKEYCSGDSKVQALNGVSLDFRDHEFVSILGPSGCGKTTLLNIIGGLDQYTDGDLIINDVSTKEYKDRDWDHYRNHSIGFVFQSYNLIPHQTVLANVELALTLSGVSKRERRRRAKEALETVGLGDQLRKKPNQMSGGQMQRVAIARALVNDPDILLADEPTGALDTKTSVQIMDILRKISKKKLIIMVTHNPSLARRYSNRIIKLVDGKVKSDSRPYYPAVGNFFKSIFGASKKEEDVSRKKKKRSMSMFTALSLSLNNLMTKKGRTLMTSFAGSIGIIGIALILSVSTGVNSYINSVQRETLSGYPIQLEAESVDLSSLITTLMDDQSKDGPGHALDKVYESMVMTELVNAINSDESKTSNDLTSFKKYLETTDAFDEYLTAVQYTYNFNWSVFVREGNEISDTPGQVVKSDVMKMLSNVGLAGSGIGGSAGTGGMGGMASMMSGGFNVWQEMLAPLDENGDSYVNNVLMEQYEIIDDGGRWPTAPNEVVLVVDKNNEISDLALYALGLRTEAEMQDAFKAAMSGEQVDTSNRKSWDYETIRQMEFRLILAAENYEKQPDGTYLDLSQTSAGREKLYSDESIGFTLKVVGIIRPREGVSSTALTGSIGYTSALAKEALKRTSESQLIKEQKENLDLDVITGKPFSALGENDAPLMMTVVKNYLATMEEAAAKAFVLKLLAPAPTDAEIAARAGMLDTTLTDPQLIAILTPMMEQIPSEELGGMTVEQLIAPPYRSFVLQMLAKEMLQSEMNETSFGTLNLQETLDALTLDENGELVYEAVNTLYSGEGVPHDHSDSTYANNLFLLGDVNQEKPQSIYLYASSFEDKDKIGALITDYNNSVDEAKKISYTDYVKILMSSITTVLNAITYVLIAFVAISLVVSSIMIGIITYISVLERTKEIGILRAIGASKRDVGRVFNAETLIVGFVAGVIGIGSTLLLNQLVNRILFHFTEIPNLKAVLPVGGAIILVVISMFLTFIAGLLPSGYAAKKNPVEALRSE